MHELALSQGIIDLVTEYARREGMQTVTRVVVEVGAAAAVEAEALQFCFDMVAEHSAARGAILVIERTPLRARCADCAGEYEPDGLVAACPRCGAYGPALLGGRELRVKSFDGA